MEEKSLRITGANTTFFNKITNTITKILIPTKIGINGMLISMKRNAVIKAFESYKNEEREEYKEEAEKKYDNAYTVYLEALDKYVLDSIYKKVKNGTASEFERDALAKYYEVVSLKEKQYNEYKYRKQKYLIELDQQGVEANQKEKIIKRYNKFYTDKMDFLYKSLLKNYSIKLADTTNIYDTSKEWIYVKIFSTLEEYIQNILYIKIKLNGDDEISDTKEDYDKFQSFTVGKLDPRDSIEKNMILLGISRKKFTHSIPLVVAEQCYEKLLKDTRMLIQDTKMAAKREKVYNLLINLIEEYNIKLLSTKVYWENAYARGAYKKFWDKYKKLDSLKEEYFAEYTKQKEILFIKEDMKKIRDTQYDYSKLKTYYKRKLMDYEAIRTLKGYSKSFGKFTGAIIEDKVRAKYA